MTALYPRAFSLTRCLLSAFCALLTAAAANATPAPLGSNTHHLAFRHVLQDDVSAIGYLNVIAQGPQGYMWFGGANGLALYDGYSLTLHHQDDQVEGSLPHSFINDLLHTSDGNFWVATRGGLARFEPNTETFLHYPVPAQAHIPGAAAVNSIAEASDGRLWLGTAAGLFSFDPRNGSFSHHPVLTREGTNAPPDNPNIWKIAIDQNQLLWLGYQTQGAVAYDPITGSAEQYSTTDQRISFDDVRELHVDSHNTVWAGTYGGGLNQLVRDKNRFERVMHDRTEKSAVVWAVLEDTRGNLWIGDGSAVHVRAPGATQFARFANVANDPHSLGNYVVNEIFEDAAGDIWLGFFPSGVDMVDRQASAFHNFNHNPINNNSVADGGILSSHEDAEGNIWIGAGYGLSYFDRGTQTFTHYRHDPDEPGGLSGNTILAMTQDRQHNLWLGVWSGGLNKLDLRTGEFTHYLPENDNPTSLLGREPWSVIEDREGFIWIATEEGVSRYNPQSDDFTRFLPASETGEGQERLYTRVVYEDRQGAIWAGAESGLYHIDRATGAFTRYRHRPADPQSISANFVLALYEDSAGRFWVGTDGGGLNLLDRTSGTFTAYSTEQGLPDGVVAGIVEDEDGYIWLGTQRGIARFDPENQTFRNYDKRHGLSDNLFNRNTPLRTQSGELFFGNSKGFTLFDPRQLPFNDTPPRVVLRDLKIANEPVAIGAPGSPLQTALGRTDTVTLTHDQSVITLGFAALDYRLPEENNYAYRLRGFDKGWNYTGGKRTATYTNLDPGIYQFEVIGANADGVWSTKPASLTLRILPPLWRTWWAYSLYAVAAVMLLWWFVRVQRLKVSYEHQKVEKERAQVRHLMELAQLKDDVMRNLDQKVAERTAELHKKNESLREAQRALEEANEKLEMASLSDPLTHLYNRRFVNKCMPADVALVEREYRNWLKGHPTPTTPLPAEADLVFMVLDVDHFKAINDNHGHSAGDRVLEQLSRLLETVLRESDYLVRWGGEEFLLVARFCSRSEAPLLAERIRQTVASATFDIGKGRLNATCSIGLSVYPFYCHAPEAVTWEQVIDTADRALYTAKHTGRNKWIWIASEPAYRGRLHNPASCEDLDALAQEHVIIYASDEAAARQTIELPVEPMDE